MRRFTILAFAALLITGCAVGPDYQRPPVTTPEQLREVLARPT